MDAWAGVAAPRRGVERLRLWQGSEASGECCLDWNFGKVSVLCRNQYCQGTEGERSNGEHWGVKKVEICRQSGCYIGEWWQVD